MYVAKARLENELAFVNLSISVLVCDYFITTFVVYSFNHSEHFNLLATGCHTRSSPGKYVSMVLV